MLTFEDNIKPTAMPPNAMRLDMLDTSGFDDITITHREQEAVVQVAPAAISGRIRVED